MSLPQLFDLLSADLLETVSSMATVRRQQEQDMDAKKVGQVTGVEVERAGDAAP